MKDFKKLILSSSVIALLLIVGTCSFLLTGCASKNSQTANGKSAASDSRGNGTTPSGKGKTDPAQTKQMMQENIKSLVADGTITQDQSDKIVEALSSNTQKFSGQKKTQNNQQNNQQNNTQNNSQSNAQGSKQNRQRNNPLSKLVSDGVITQAQADAVLQKVRGNFTRPQGTPGTSDASGT